MKKKLYLTLILFLFVNILSASPKDNIQNETKKTPNENQTETDKSEIIKIPLIYISDFEGRFINIDNTKGNYYDLLGKIKYYQNVLPIVNNWEKAITLNNGASFWPSISIRFLLNQKKGMDLIYSLLNENHFDIINLGKKDFYTPYEIMEKLSNHNNIKTLPFMSSNTDCSKTKNLPVCKLIKNKKYKILKIHDIKIAIISVVSPKVIHKAFYKSVKNLKISPEVETINKLAKFLKKQKGVDIIIALIQTEEKETNPRKTFLLSQDIKEVDIIISNASDIKSIKKFSNNIYLLGSNPDRYTPNLVLLNIKKNNKKHKLENIVNLNNEYKGKIKISKVFKDVLDKYKNRYLKQYDIPINNMKITSLDFETFYKFILKLMLYDTNSEIAFINKANFNYNLFPIKKLTKDIIEKAIVYNNKITVFYMKGIQLKKFIKKYKNSLLYEGISFVKKKKITEIKINNHFIIDKKMYKIVTTDFLANGGDNFFTNEFFIPNKSYHQNIKTVFINYLKQDKFKNPDSKFDPDEEFKDLNKKFLWEFYGNSGFYYIKNDISNENSYEKSQFASTPNELLKLDIILNLQGISKYHIIKNNFELHYYQSNENNTEFVESNDLITYSLNYKNNYFKIDSPDNFLIPLPFLETKLNTELTKPDEQNKRYLELFFLTGISFLSFDKKFEIRTGIQGSKDFRDEGNILLGALIGYNLNNYKLKSFKTPVKISSRLDFFAGFDKTDIAEFSTTLNIPLLGFFHFSTKGEAYAYKEKDKNWSYAYNFFFGINIIYNKWYR